jgi:hypothetical protein
MGALELAETDPAEPWSSEVVSTPVAAMVGADTGGTAGACTGGADPDPVEFISPCDN